jgi:hypothetical protein
LRNPSGPHAHNSSIISLSVFPPGRPPSTQTLPISRFPHGYSGPVAAGANIFPYFHPSARNVTYSSGKQPWAENSTGGKRSIKIERFCREKRRDHHDAKRRVEEGKGIYSLDLEVAWRSAEQREVEGGGKGVVWTSLPFLASFPCRWILFYFSDQGASVAFLFLSVSRFPALVYACLRPRRWLQWRPIAQWNNLTGAISFLLVLECFAVGCSLTSHRQFCPLPSRTL